MPGTNWDSLIHTEGVQVEQMGPSFMNTVAGVLGCLTSQTRLSRRKTVKINQDPNARQPGKYSLRKWHETASKVDETLARQKTQTVYPGQRKWWERSRR